VAVAHLEGLQDRVLGLRGVDLEDAEAQLGICTPLFRVMFGTVLMPLFEPLGSGGACYGAN